MIFDLCFSGGLPDISAHGSVILFYFSKFYFEQIAVFWLGARVSMVDFLHIAGAVLSGCIAG